MNNPITLLYSLPGALAQGLIWGIMAIGVAITYKILDYADLTVDNSLCTGGAVAAITRKGKVAQNEQDGQEGWFG